MPTPTLCVFRALNPTTGAYLRSTPEKFIQLDAVPLMTPNRASVSMDVSLGTTPELARVVMLGDGCLERVS